MAIKPRVGALMIETMRSKYDLDGRPWRVRNRSERETLIESLYHLENLSKADVVRVTTGRSGPSTRIFRDLAVRTKSPEKARLELSRRNGAGSRGCDVGQMAVDQREWKGKVYYLNPSGVWFTIRKPTAGKPYRSFNYHRATDCSNCGQEMFTKRNRTVRSFCSRKCTDAGNSGPNNHGWKGGRRVNHLGYVVLADPTHPQGNNGLIKEHRLVMEQKLGRFLERHEVVHHIDCDKQNNDPANLVVMDKSQHAHAHGSIEDCVKKLISMNVLWFNNKTLKYEVRE